MLKKLLLVGAIIAIIPLERENQADLYQAAKSTFRDITGFCGRNPGVCEKGNAAIDKFATKAEFGARMMVDIAKEQSGTSSDEVAQLLRATKLPGSLIALVPCLFKARNVFQPIKTSSITSIMAQPAAP